MPIRLKPGGINIYYDPVLGTSVETHTSTCCHCQHITEFESRKKMFEAVDICRGCMRLICLECVGKPCVPYEKQAEIIENAHKLASRVHLQAWRCY